MDYVEQAFGDDPQVVTASIHMDTAFAYPFRGGGLDETGRLGNAVNLPLPQGAIRSDVRDCLESLLRDPPLLRNRRIGSPGTQAR